jgi:hypothetical protein
MIYTDEIATLLHIHDKAFALGTPTLNIANAAMARLRQINDQIKVDAFEPPKLSTPVAEPEPVEPKKEPELVIIPEPEPTVHEDEPQTHVEETHDHD